jgi:hypothetical protein
MTARLPIPGDDNGTWGTLLNEFLQTAHASDGSLLSSAVQGSLPAHIPTTNLGTGTASASTFLRGDGTWAAAPSATNATTSSPGIVQLAGDLAGTATSPTVQKISGVAISGTPGVGNALVATTSSAATWSSAVGPAGPAGPTGLNWLGLYSGATTYGINDAVAYASGGLTASYINLVGSTGIAPPTPLSGTSNSTWSLLVSPGSTGAAGASGSNSLLAPITSGEETVSRLMLGQNDIALDSGTMTVIYFTATKTETINRIIMATGTSASGTTKARVGVYTVNRATGALTSLIASSAASTTLWQSSYQPPAAAFDNYATLSSGWSKVAGTDYAIGLFYAGTTAPQLVGNLIAAGAGDGGVAPRIAGRVSSLTDLPSTQPTVASYGLMPYVAMTA